MRIEVVHDARGLYLEGNPHFHGKSLAMSEDCERKERSLEQV